MQAPSAPADAAIAALTGAWIWVDPATGALVNTRPEGVAMPKALVASPNLEGDGSELPSFALRHGGRGVHVGGRFVTTARAHVAADGSLHWGCGDDHTTAASEPAPVSPGSTEAPQS